MNKKGFTLIEMITSVAILLLITVIAIPSVTSLLSKSDDKLDKAVKKQLISYAKSYMKDKEYLEAIEPDKKYCLLINDITEENFVNQDNDEITGRIEIQKTGDDIAYTYSEKNDLDDCEPLPEISIELDDELLNLSSNSNPDIDPNTLKGKLIDLYEYIEDVPDFKVKAPINNTDNLYRVVEKSYTYPNYKGYVRLFNSGDPYTLYPLSSSDNYQERETFNEKTVFGKSYTFNKNTGTFTLSDTKEGYMNIYDFPANGYKYTCNKNNNKCNTLYRVNDYSCNRQWFIEDMTNYRYNLDFCHITSGVKYIVKPEIGGGSGLFKTYDDKGPIYYFRGKITNNYVMISGNMFQILRFNSDNSIRLVSLDPIFENGTTNPKKIKYNGIYDEYRNVYELENYSDTQTMFRTDNINMLSNIKVYDQIKLKDKFNTSDGYTYTQSNIYPTLDKCFPSGTTNPCKNKYISLDLNSDNTDSDSNKVWYKFTDNINSKKYKISTVRYSPYSSNCRNGYNTCKYNFTAIKQTTKSDSQALWDSQLKVELENWYNTKIKPYASSITILHNFCTENDVSLDSDILIHFLMGSSANGNISKLYSPVSRLDISKNKLVPTYTCYNDDLRIVGTLTADEVVFAGAISQPIYKSFSGYFLEDSDTHNTDFFLFRDNGYLTLSNSFDGYVAKYHDTYSPVTYRFSGTYNHIYQFYGKINNEPDIGSLIHSDIAAPVYPVINIRGDVKFTGTGTLSDPFQIILD